MSHLIHLIYSSAAVRPFSPGELSTLLGAARESNEHLGVTGMLLYSNETFFQVLEGSQPVVDDLFQRIERDPRHHRAVTIIREPISRRTFAEWSMGYAALGGGVREEPGMNDFFDEATCFTTLSTGRAKKLLNAFATGRWRARIEGAGSPQYASVGS
ncbi:MAG: BLUF domain-containing protein [Cytophagaceae bacterium]|nr:BLUF domain-containing protein [Gemmatimonadaceae bacterium]